VALCDGRIIVEGGDSMEALENALKKRPGLKPEEIVLHYIQVADVLIL
jgi:hypothetical protein